MHLPGRRRLSGRTSIATARSRPTDVDPHPAGEAVTAQRRRGRQPGPFARAGRRFAGARDATFPGNVMRLVPVVWCCVERQLAVVQARRLQGRSVWDDLQEVLVNELGLRSGVNSSSVDQLVADLGLSGKSPRDEMETPNQRQP